MEVLQLIGHTPLVRLTDLSAQAGAAIYVKVESRNPGASIKDRAAQAYLTRALERGALQPGGMVVEATSGNLGIGLALVCSQLGLNLTLAMPASVSRERMILLRAMGAELILTPAAEGMGGAQAKAAALLAEHPAAFRPNQFDNPDGPDIHYLTTGLELLESAQAESLPIHAFVAGVGSGATISGVGKRLREADPHVHLAAVEPAESPVLSGGKPGPHGIQGIGAGFVPQVFNASLVNEVIQVSTTEAMETARHLFRHEALSCGISSGANVRAATILASRPEFQGKNIVTVICDTGERYLSTSLFAEYAPPL